MEMSLRLINRRYKSTQLSPMTIIGGGNMAEAILTSLSQTQGLAKVKIQGQGQADSEGGRAVTVVDPRSERLAYLKEKFHVTTYMNAEEALKANSELVVSLSLSYPLSPLSYPLSPLSYPLSPLSLSLSVCVCLCLSLRVL